MTGTCTTHTAPAASNVVPHACCRPSLPAGDQLAWVVLAGVAVEDNKDNSNLIDVSTTGTYHGFGVQGALETKRSVVSSHQRCRTAWP